MSTDLGRALAGQPTDGRAFRIGKVTAYNATTRLVTVELDGSPVVAPSMGSGYQVGQSVLVGRDGKAGAYVLGTIGTTPTTPPSSPPPPPSYVQRSKVALPRQADTYRGGWRGVPDLYQGDYTGRGLNFGAAFYGSQLQGLRAITSLARSATLTIRRLEGGSYAAQAPTFKLLQQSAKPGGAPTVRATAAGPAVAVGRTATWALPTAWLDELLAGTSGGLGIQVGTASPYIHLAGPSSAANGMALSVSYYTAT